MTLREWIAENATATLNVRIGTERASGFIFIGSVAKLLEEEAAINDAVRAENEKMLKSLKTFEAGKKKSQGTGNNIRKVPTPFVPISDREIKDVIPSMINDDLVVIITGCERLLDYEPEPVDPDTWREDGIRQMIEQVYKIQARELVRLYRAMMHPKDLVSALATAQAAADIEQWFKADVYGYLEEDPHGFVRELVKLTDQQIKEARKHE